MKSIEDGRAAAKASGQSCATWDLLELSFRFGRGEGREAMQLMQHIESTHLKEPGVADRLTQMLVEVGLLNPDGTPAALPGMAQRGPEPPVEDTGRLWTPDQESSGGGGGKLWTPGS